MDTSSFPNETIMVSQNIINSIKNKIEYTFLIMKYNRCEPLDYVYFSIDQF